MAKPHKVAEPAGTYTVSKKNAKRPKHPLEPAAPPGKESVRYLDADTAGKLADKIFSERKNLLQKLAQ